MAEVVLRHFDLNYGSKSSVRYIRYVDDIRLFATREDDLRRMLVRLDTLSKDVGLFPQAAKINIHEIRDIEGEIKSVSNAYDPHEDEDKFILSNQDALQKALIQLSPRFRVEDDTKFKFLLAHADPTSKLNSRLLGVSLNRPDLVPNVMRYFRKYERLPISVASQLLDRLSKEPLYQNITAEIVDTLGERTPVAYSRRLVRILKKRWKPRILQSGLLAAVGKQLIRRRLLSESRTRYACKSVHAWWVRAELFAALDTTYHGRLFVENLLNEGLRDEVGDTALSAVESLASLALSVAPPIRNLNPTAAKALRQLGLISRLPRGVDGMERSFGRLLGQATRINWRALFGRDYKQGEKQAVLCRAMAETNATAFVNATDVFNDMLLFRLYRHDPSLGGYVLGNIGSVLSSIRLRRMYPETFALVSEVHGKRYISNLSHARARRSGKPTTRIKYSYVKRARRLMARAFAEIGANY